MNAKPATIGNGEIKATVDGEMFLVPADAFQVNITDTNYNKVTGFNKGKESNISIDEVLGTFTIDFSGTYHFSGVASVFVSAGLLLNFSMFVNDIQIEKTESLLDYKNSQDTNNLSGSGELDLVKGDIVDVRAKSDTQPATVSITNMNINMHRIGY